MLLLSVAAVQVPGAIMMGPYKAPKEGEEIIGYEVYFPRVSGTPRAQACPCLSCSFSGWLLWACVCWPHHCRPAPPVTAASCCAKSLEV